MEVPTTTIKMTYGGETKPALLASPEEDHWNSLEKQFREQFSISTEDIKAKYVDEEGDRVSIDSNEELRHLLAQGKPLQLEFSLEGQNMKKREGGRRISCEDRLRLRQERMMKKFGKVLTKEELIQLREERKKERMMKKEEKVAKLEERKKFQQQRRIDRMIKKFGKILSEEELTQKREEMRNKRMLKKFGKVLSEEERAKQRIERRAACKCKRSAEEITAERDEDSSSASKKEEGDKEGPARRPRLSREEKRELNQQRKKQRLEERQARKEARKSAAADDDLVDWPADATHLFLDGNNMMFLTANLRGLTLGRGGNRHQAEALLAAAAKSFVLSQPEGTKMQQAVLIFDSTKTDQIAKIGRSTEEISFRICSARPQFPTSDDALIAWAKEGKDQGISSGMVFVTSDRALRDQLKEAGGRLMKPKQFLRLARRLSLALAGTPLPSSDTQDTVEGDGLDAWLSSLSA